MSSPELCTYLIDGCNNANLQPVGFLIPIKYTEIGRFFFSLHLIEMDQPCVYVLPFVP